MRISRLNLMKLKRKIWGEPVEVKQVPDIRNKSKMQGLAVDNKENPIFLVAKCLWEF
ncbi:four-carbon acid sugar kinase family protein [Sesbania bispinosa]|nr:four-carbon acid sugar kinase family protein [Sesbania bispinosa]